MSATTIALANLKGGCGKSTLAFNLAAGLMPRGQVALVDADPQGALRHWADWADDKSGLPTVVDGHDDPVVNLQRAATAHDYVVIDCPPSLDMQLTARILEQVQLVLVPVLPSPIDLWASAGTVDAVERARKNNPRLRGWLVLNQTEPRSALSRAMVSVVANLKMPLLNAAVRRRAAYRTAVVEGVSVYQLGPRGQEAVRDIELVIEEVMQS